jgi:cell division transport system permease protein
MRAQFVFHEVWIGLRRNLTMTIAVVVVVAISLSLLGTGLLFVKQIQETRNFWQGRVQLSVYLCTQDSSSPQCIKNGPASAAEKATIQQTLSRMPQVASVTYVNPSQAYQQFKVELPSLVSSVTPGEVPDSFQIRLKNTQADSTVVQESVDGQPGVDQIVDDSSILSRFYGLLTGARNAVVVIAIILVIAAILLVANTIRLSAFNRRRETSIMRLVGASNFYIQLPFLVEGVIAGVCGWLVATGLLVAVKSLWLNSLQNYFPLHVELTTTDLIEVIILSMVLGVLLTGTTSFLTLRRYLRI